MASHQVILLVLCGEIWRSLSAAAAQHAAMTESHTSTTARSPGADKASPYHLQPTGPSSYQPDRSLAVTEGQAFPEEEEAGDGSWVAALLIGIILIGMAMAIIVILLWKCCTRPVLAETHWAGRSPFADGDTPDLITDSDQGTKRSSVLFMLPWKLKEGTNSQEDPKASENPRPPSTGTENGQLPLPAPGCSGTATDTDPDPAPASAPARSTAEPCPHPHTAPEPSDLPAPPEWLREPAEDPSKHSALPWETEEPLPPPPEPLTPEIHGSLPQPEHLL
ncbi:EVI2B protein, partial [Pardalotus punctatus]|nr:EVI2B protein [Pardalotus punctatus]